jgi:hypothetical protein
MNFRPLQNGYWEEILYLKGNDLKEYVKGKHQQ